MADGESPARIPRCPVAKRSGMEISMTDTERLAAFEKMLQNVKDRYEDSTAKMEKLKAQGKEKSVTYKQLMADKLTMQKILSMYNIFGIE